MPQRHNSDSSVTSSHNGGGYMRYRAKYPPRRPYWSNAPVPPRFERNNKHYPDPEIDSSCETEELPNGFTKIRSKNLDVLFRKDYYAQRTLSAATTSSSAVSSEQGEPPEEDPTAEQCSVTEQPVVPEEEEEDDEAVAVGDVNDHVDADEGVHAENVQGEVEPPTSQEADLTSKSAASTLDGKEASVIEDSGNKTTVPKSKSVINTNATPFYPASYVPIPPPMPPSTYGMSPVSPGGGVSRPNLFLYSPSSNTMIPCEEIIIPNAVVPGQDVYQGPSNIYLAFPMENGTGGHGTGPGSTTAGTTPPPAPQPSTSVTSCGSSTNSTPPQAQSPQTSSSATGKSFVF